MQTQEQEAYKQITKRIIGAAIEVHKQLGPGLLESAYEHCLAIELKHRGVPYDRQRELPIVYRGYPVGTGYRLDFLVMEKVVIEIKSVKEITPVHKAQILSYMKLGNWKCGLLLNFNVDLMKNGVKRFLF